MLAVSLKTFPHLSLILPTFFFRPQMILFYAYEPSKPESPCIYPCKRFCCILQGLNISPLEPLTHSHHRFSQARTNSSSTIQRELHPLQHWIVSLISLWRPDILVTSQRIVQEFCFPNFPPIFNFSRDLVTRLSLPFGFPVCLWFKLLNRHRLLTFSSAVPPFLPYTSS